MVTKLQAAKALWEAGDISYKLWEQQEPIYRTIRSLPKSAQIAVLLCARQFGKSVFGVIMATEECLRNPNVVVMIIGPTIKQTRAIVRPRMRLIMHDCPPGLIRPVKSEDTWYFSNGAELVLGGFDTGSSNQRGKTLHKIFIEEIVDSDPDSYDDFLRSDLGPALTHSKNAQIIFLTTLPKIPDHPFCLETVPESESIGSFFKFTIDDNKKLTQEQYDKCVKLAGGRDSIDFKREYLCEQVRDSTIILAPEFSEDIHVKEFMLPEYANFWIGGDVGGVRDKSVFLLCSYDFLRAKTLIIDERSYDPETGSGAMVADCLAMEKPYSILARFVDSDGQLRVDFMLQHNYPVSLPQKDELDPSVNLVRVALARGEIEIHPRCKMLIRTLRSGTFNKSHTDLARSKVLGHMDAFMALVYALRHAIKSNPYPLYGGASEDTHYIDRNTREFTTSEMTIKNMFGVR